MRKFTFCTLLLLLFSVLAWSQTFDDQLTQINGYIKNGDYFRAENLCNYYLKQPKLAENQRTDLLEKIDWIKHYKDMETQVLYFIKKQNYQEAITIIKRKEQDGITSSSNRSKEMSKLLDRAVSYKNTSIEQRYIDVAIQYLASGQKERARTIFIQFHNNPIAILKLGEIEKGPIIPPKPCDTKKYAKLKRDLEIAYRDCRLEKAKTIANEITVMDCYKNDRYAITRKNSIRTIQSQLQNIANWRSGGDPSQRDFVIPEYQKVFIKNPNCVEWDYFYYVYYIAERIRQNYPCSKDAILWYRKAAGISPTLTIKENIAQKIADIENCTKCNDKDALFKAIIAEAEAYYKDCQYTKADSIYREALKYKCSDQTTVLGHWENDILPNISKNRNNALLFTKYKSTADSLAALSECTEAMKYYKAADSLNLDCGKLNKSDLAIKIAKMECCDVKYKFDKIKDSLNRAIKDPNTLTNVADKTRAICHLVEIMRDMAVGGDCIEANDMFAMESVSCKICCTYYPDRECCKIPPPPLDTTKYTTWEVSVGAYGINPQLESSARSFSNQLGLGGGIVGIHYIYGTKNGELKLGLQYAYDSFKASPTEVIKRSTTQVSLNLTVPLGGEKQRMKQIYPFVELGVSPQIPISFSDFQSTNQVTTTDLKLLNNLYVSYHFAAGLQVRKLSFNIFYNRAGDIFSLSAAARPLQISASNFTTLGLSTSYRFALKRGMQ